MTNKNEVKHKNKSTYELPETSSLQKYLLCDTCNRKFIKKYNISRHFYNGICVKSTAVCNLCSKTFKSRKSLVFHEKFKHKISSSAKNKTIKNLLSIPTSKTDKQKNPRYNVNKYQCEGCYIDFVDFQELQYHIRSNHFNLHAKIPYAERKKVNQVWFEKVHNSNVIMEIKKTGNNSLIMRRLHESTSIKVNNQETETIDLSHLYPTKEYS